MSLRSAESKSLGLNQFPSSKREDEEEGDMKKGWHQNVLKSQPWP